MIGVDIEKIKRFKKKLKDNSFLNRIFTDQELNYCFSKKYPEKHLASRFAGKEAVIKAYCSLFKKLLDFKSIEITNDISGIPKAKVCTDDSINIEISLSHTKELAIAFVFLK